jgi:hypothetical protein
MKKILFLMLACFLLAPSLALADNSFPSFPMAFYGSAKLNNENLAINSKIQAYAGDSLVGEVTLSEAGIYGYDAPTKIRLTVGEYSGSEILFKYILPGTSDALIGSSLNKYSGVFESGKTLNFNINFTTVSVPSTPSTGGGGSGSSSGGGGGGGSAAIKPIVKATTTVVIVPQKSATSTIIEIEKTKEVLGVKVVDYSSFSSLFGLNGEMTNLVSQNEAETINAPRDLVQFSGVNGDIFKKIIASRANSDFSESAKKAIAYFIQFGSPTTKRLGAGEQAGALSSYMSAFNKVPSSTLDWQDVIKVANGRWPSQKSQAAEDNAILKFKKVYLRAPDMKNPNDNAAVTVIAYGLRPASRNTNSEKSAIKSFKAIFKYNPTSAVDWDVVRSIAYSGAKR